MQQNQADVDKSGELQFSVFSLRLPLESKCEWMIAEEKAAVKRPMVTAVDGEEGFSHIKPNRA